MISGRKKILEREKNMYQRPEINERSLINNAFRQYELSRTFSPPPAKNKTSLSPEATFLPAALPSYTTVTEAFSRAVA